MMLNNSDRQILIQHLCCHCITTKQDELRTQVEHCALNLDNGVAGMEIPSGSGDMCHYLIKMRLGIAIH